MGLLVQVRNHLLHPAVIRSSSMAETLLVGDMVLVRKRGLCADREGVQEETWPTERFSRGEIIRFRAWQDEGRWIVKRVIGLPGDTLAMEAGVVRINGSVLSEPYLAASEPQPRPRPDPRLNWQEEHLLPSKGGSAHPATIWDWGPLIVPGGKYFVMGDNRRASADSRLHGFVDSQDIWGVVFFVYFSVSPDPDSGWGETDQRIRWRRLGFLENLPGGWGGCCPHP